MCGGMPGWNSSMWLCVSFRVVLHCCLQTHSQFKRCSMLRLLFEILAGTYSLALGLLCSQCAPDKDINEEHVSCIR